MTEAHGGSFGRNAVKKVALLFDPIYGNIGAEEGEPRIVSSISSVMMEMMHLVN